MNPRVAPSRSDIIFAVDEYHRWYAFDRRNPVAAFDSWNEANAFRNGLDASEATDSAPAWTPKSGGY